MTEELTVEVTSQTEKESDEHDRVTTFEGTINGEEWTAERLSGEDYASIKVFEVFSEDNEKKHEAIMDALWYPDDINLQ